MVQINKSIKYWLNSWEECSECNDMVLPKMISNRFITGKIRCKECQTNNLRERSYYDKQ